MKRTLRLVVNPDAPPPLQRYDERGERDELARYFAEICQVAPLEYMRRLVVIWTGARPVAECVERAQLTQASAEMCRGGNLDYLRALARRVGESMDEFAQVDPQLRA